MTPLLLYEISRFIKGREDFWDFQHTFFFYDPFNEYDEFLNYLRLRQAYTWIGLYHRLRLAGFDTSQLLEGLDSDDTNKAF
jgi:hypothetical protein